MGPKAALYAGDTKCLVAGRVSMDVLTIDITDLAQGPMPDTLDIICVHQGVDVLADAAGTIGYEVLTALGSRYTRDFINGLV